MIFKRIFWIMILFLILSCNENTVGTTTPVAEKIKPSAEPASSEVKHPAASQPSPALPDDPFFSQPSVIEGTSSPGAKNILPGTTGIPVENIHLQLVDKSIPTPSPSVYTPPAYKPLDCSGVSQLSDISPEISCGRNLKEFVIRQINRDLEVSLSGGEFFSALMDASCAANIENTFLSKVSLPLSFNSNLYKINLNFTDSLMYSDFISLKNNYCSTTGSKELDGSLTFLSELIAGNEHDNLWNKCKLQESESNGNEPGLKISPLYLSNGNLYLKMRYQPENNTSSPVYIKDVHFYGVQSESIKKCTQLTSDWKSYKLGEFKNISETAVILNSTGGSSEVFFPLITYKDKILLPDTNAGAIPEELPVSLSEGLVAYYPFNGNARDESGNGNDGTVRGPVLTEDRFGKFNSAYSFDGDDDGIVVEDPDKLNLGDSSRSFSVWFKISLLSTGLPQVIFAKQKRIDPYTGYSIVLNVNQHNNYYYQMGESFFSGSRFITGITVSDKPVANKWTHLVVVYEKGRTVSIYIDGKRAALLISGFTGKYNTDYPVPFQIGRSVNSEGLDNTHFFNGSLDDIRVYDRLLSEGEIQALYKSRN